jgi:hypothetical protein
MTIDDAMRALSRIFPEAQVEFDNDGQLVIYTNCRCKGFDLLPCEPEEV